MVDFNNEATIGTPAIDIVRVLVLQRRADLFEAMEDYKKTLDMGQDKGLSVVKARLFSLFMEIQAQLKRRNPPEVYNNLLNTILNSENETDVFNAIYSVNEYLDKIRLTMLDTRRDYDTTIAEEENEEKGL